MSKTKVLHIVEALGGGIYSYFMDMSYHHGRNTSLLNHLVYSDKRNEIQPEKVRTDIDANVAIIKVSMKKEIAPFADMKSVIELVRILKKIRPDVVHLHSSKAGVIGRLAHFFSRSKSRLYYTPHGYAFLRQDISSGKQRVYRFIEKSMSQLFSGTTIACGDTEMEYAEKLGDSILVRNGINIPEIRIHKKPFQNKRLTIGILGRITFARNPSLFNKLALAFPDISFKWIGDGELRNEITAPNIEVTGWFTDRSIGLSHLNDLDIYLQTSLWEGLPISLLEAMALEKPILATNIIGNKDVVVHGETGFLFDTPAQFASYVDVLTSETERKQMGANGYKRVMEVFNCQKNFEQLGRVYIGDYSNT